MNNLIQDSPSEQQMPDFLPIAKGSKRIVLLFLCVICIIGAVFIIDKIFNLHIVQSFAYAKEAKIDPNDSWMYEVEESGLLGCGKENSIFIKVGYSIKHDPTIGLSNLTGPFVEKSGSNTYIWDLKTGKATPYSGNSDEYKVSDGQTKCHADWILPERDLNQDIEAIRLFITKGQFDFEKTASGGQIPKLHYDQYTLKFGELDFPNPEQYNWLF